MNLGLVFESGDYVLMGVFLVLVLMSIITWSVIIVRALKLRRALAEAGVLVRDHFPLLCGPGTPWPEARIVTADGGPPVAPDLGPELLCLPLHGRMTEADLARCCAVIRAEMMKDTE